MIFNEQLQNLIHLLATVEDPATVMEQTFSPIAEMYGLGILEYQYVMFSDNISYKSPLPAVPLYVHPNATGHSAPALEISFPTNHGEGTATFYLYKLNPSETFSEEEKKSLHTLCGLLSIHFDRWNMINTFQKIGHTDRLTGLPNSGGFISYADMVFKEKRLPEYNSYYFNLSRFSLINKRFGPKETDRIIVRYTQQLVDFLLEDEKIGRLGGDNFVALIRKERTEAFLQLIGGVSTYGRLDNREIPVTISAVAGVLEIEESHNVGNLLSDSSMALNVAKHMENKPYVFVSNAIKQKAFREKQIASSFMDAINNHEFMAYYQPKVRIDNYTIVGAEALVRWKHEGNFLPPGEFIPVLEQTGMICVLDFYMLEQICMDIKNWLAKGIEPVKISLNFSRRNLANPNLAQEIVNVLKKYELDSKYIEIELTETVDQKESQLLETFMNEMKKYDIAMSIDDFGTGYSSLNMLRSFPVDVLKLDKTFIDRLEKNDRIVVSNIIRMADELHMNVVAEGVETIQQMDYLKKMDCKVVQGNLFDMPLPEPEFENKMEHPKYNF